jgi:hypothetical protein
MTADIRDAGSMIDDLTRLLPTIARASFHDRHLSDFSSIVTGSLAAAAAVGLRLPVPPQVIADTDPHSVWWEDSAIRNPALDDSDLITVLSEGAHATVPLPNVDVRIDSADRVPG